MNALQPWHILLVVAVFLILFGSKKLPDAARGLGRSMRIFKSEVEEMKKDTVPDSDVLSAGDALTDSSAVDVSQPLGRNA